MGRDIRLGLAAVDSGLDSLNKGVQQGEDREWQRKKREQEEKLWPLEERQAAATVQQSEAKGAKMADELTRERAWFDQNNIDPEKMYQEMTFMGASAKTPEVMAANKGKDMPVPNIVAFNNAFPTNPKINNITVGDNGGYVAHGTDPKNGQETSWPVMPDEIKRAIIYAGPKATMQFYGNIMRQQMQNRSSMDRATATTQMRLDAETPLREARTDQARAATGLSVQRTRNAEKGRSDYDQRYQQLLDQGVSPAEAMDRATGTDIKREGLDLRREGQNDRRSQLVVQGADASIRNTLRKYAPQEAANIGTMTSEQLMASLMSGKSGAIAELNRRAQAGDRDAMQDMTQLNSDVAIIQDISRSRANQYRVGQGQTGAPAAAPSAASGGALTAPSRPTPSGGITDSRTGRYIPEGTTLRKKDGSRWIVQQGQLKPLGE